MEREKVIPDEWRNPVIRILREGDKNCIDWTHQAFLDWRAATLSQFRNEAYEAMANSLSVAGILGAPVSLEEDGETYAFFFRYEERVLYGKVCLRPSGKEIKIVSAHTPRKGGRLF